MKAVGAKRMRQIIKISVYLMKRNKKEVWKVVKSYNFSYHCPMRKIKEIDAKQSDNKTAKKIRIQAW